jgi:hypothetical protein
MNFRRVQSSIIFSIAILLFFVFGYRYLSFSTVVVLTVLLFAFLVYLSSTFYQVIEGKLIGYILFTKNFEIQINSIKYIEAITVKKAGQIYITIGKSEAEDSYILHLKDGSTLKIDNYYRNHGKSLGRFLKEKYKINFKETEKIKYLYGNP